MKAFFREKFPETAAWLYRHRNHIPAAALLIGLVWDSLTLGRPDQLFDNAVLLFYILLAGTGILIMSRRRERGVEPSVTLLAIVQFSFGNLTSGLFVLYNISGTIAGNWLFFVLLIGLLIGNELLRTRYGQLRFNIAVYYLLVLAYLVLIVPVFTGSIGVGIFLLSGLLSIVVIGIFLLIARVVAPETARIHWSQTIAAVGAILVIFNMLYFTNFIPPVPLALRDAGIYHNVVQTADGFQVTYEEPAWYRPFRDSDDIIYLTATGRAYCFSSVFAPPGLATPIYHRWEYRNPETDVWETRSRISFSIVGGRDAGYRGYSEKTISEPGSWRCSVETERGSLMGRVSVQAIDGVSAPEFTTELR